MDGTPFWWDEARKPIRTACCAYICIHASLPIFYLVQSLSTAVYPSTSSTPVSVSVLILHPYYFEVLEMIWYKLWNPVVTKLRHRYTTSYRQFNTMLSYNTPRIRQAQHTRQQPTYTLKGRKTKDKERKEKRKKKRKEKKELMKWKKKVKRVAAMAMWLSLTSSFEFLTLPGKHE